MNPNDRIALQFSPMSLAKRRAEYAEVRESLRTSLNHPDADAHDVRIVQQLLREHEPVPSIGNITFVMYYDEWAAVSRALRRWRTDSSQPRPYQIAARAWSRREYL